MISNVIGYDKERRLIKVSDCTGAVIEYRYDSLGQRTYERRKINEDTYQITNYKFDGHGNILEISRSSDQLGTGRRFTTTEYTYDANGNVIKIITPKGYIIERSYDSAQRLVQERHMDKVSGIANHITMDYDAAGNITAITGLNGEKISYTYDLMNREIQRADEMGGITRTIYNKNGQIIQQIQPNQYAQSKEEGKGLTYTYDIKGQITRVKNARGQVIEENTYNSAGELVSRLDSLSQGVHFTYDLGGRREKVETTGGAGQRYSYDARGNITGIVDGRGEMTRYQLDKWGRIIQIHKLMTRKNTMPMTLQEI